MAYINRLSDITNKLDINIENQVISNDKLTDSKYSVQYNSNKLLLICFIIINNNCISL